MKRLKFEKDRCLVIGEVAQAHDGSLGMAHSFIDAIANAGADAIKFQTHIASAESTPAEPWRVKFSRQDESRYDYWKRMEFTPEQWQGLKNHADEKGLYFLSSPFSIEAVELLRKVGVAAWKIASGESSNPQLIDTLLRDKLPILISTGMSSSPEIDMLVEKIKSKGMEFAVMQCTSAYPCPPEKVGLNLISNFRDRYDSLVGLSDHSGTIYPGLAAAALGANVLEVHVTLSREMFGPDVPASITTSELKQLVEGIQFIEQMNANPVDKDGLFQEMKPLRDLFTKSLFAKSHLAKGTVLRKEHLTAKKPGIGISVENLDALIGRILRRDVSTDEMINFSDLEENS